MTNAVNQLGKLGYEKLADLSPEIADRALAAAQAMAERLPRDMPPTQEPATFIVPLSGEKND